MPSAAPVRILPATAARWDDVATLLGTDGDKGCWCQAWRGLDTKQLSRGRTRPELLREQMAEANPPPGFVAYIGDDPVGWAGVGIRSATPRFLHSRTLDAIDDAPVWSIGCFRIRPGFRRKGIATALLRGIVDAARAAGAPGVEAYPIDPAGGRVEVGAGFVGLASMFDAAGFERRVVTSAHSGGLPRLLVRLDF
jgi:GNAT superfamily N-acetyltransferase